MHVHLLRLVVNRPQQVAGVLLLPGGRRTSATCGGQYTHPPTHTHRQSSRRSRQRGTRSPSLPGTWAPFAFPPHQWSCIDKKHMCKHAQLLEPGSVHRRRTHSDPMPIVVLCSLEGSCVWQVPTQNACASLHKVMLTSSVVTDKGPMLVFAITNA